MAKVEDRALRIVKAFESAGRAVQRVVIDGRRIELDIKKEQDSDEFDRIDMRHDKT